MCDPCNHVPLDDRFLKFLSKFRVTKGSEFTHTSLGKPMGSFYIPYEDMESFYENYKHAMTMGVDLHLTEKHRCIGPICIDLDFRFIKDCGEVKRQYTSEHIDIFVQLYTSYLSKYVIVPPFYKIYVQEKEHPIVNGDIIKDGVHIIIPDIVTRPSVQHLIRQDLLNDPKVRNLFENEIMTTNPCEDVFDECVIEKNNWIMVGSKKPNNIPYNVTHIIDVKGDELVNAIVNYEDVQPIDFVERLSIRNKYTESGYQSNAHPLIAEYEKDMVDKVVIKNTQNLILLSEAHENRIQNVSSDLDLVRQLINLLSEERSLNYNNWIRLGWCLRNIDHRLLDDWDNFSKKSPKYSSGECARLWSRMKASGLGIGTLHMWAKQDSPEHYAEMQRDSLRDLIIQSLSGTHHDIAKVMHHMFKHTFVCASIKNKCWYEFRNHRWHLSDCGYSLRMKISTQVWVEFSKASVYHQQQALATSLQVDQQRNQEFGKKFLEIAQKLKISSFKDNVMRECAELFYVEGFEEKLDSNLYLIGFENGVYDLQAMEFRDGRPEDFISFSTRNVYIPYNPDSPEVHGIHKYLSQVLTKPAVRDYVLRLLASFIDGTVKEQKFYIWTGSGANSKSKLVELFEKAFGDYCCKFPITLLTQKRAASNAATTELARSKGKRFASLQEPSEDERLNIGLMKELSGGDKIMARMIYKEPVEFSPQFKMLLLCNHLPNVPSDDGGTWRRIRVVEFTSKFIDNPKEDNEFPIDLSFSDKLESWKAHFMSLIIEQYKRYVTEGIHEPDEVLKCTNEYKNQNDHVSNFISQFIEKHENGCLSMSDVFQEFRSWVKNDMINIKVPNKLELEKTIARHLNVTFHTVNTVRSCKGYRIKQFDEGLDEFGDI